MIDKSDILLVSGAISNNLDKYRPVKLEGIPLVLTKDDKLKRFRRRDYGRVVHTIKRIFRSKPELMSPLLGQLDRSMSLQGAASTLSTTYISGYMHYDRHDPILICWNGDMDFKILRKLRIRGIFKLFNITAYSDKNNDEFNLKLVDIENKREIYRGYIGTMKKNGRMLNLLEAHGLICNKDHRITHTHDPVADVILTKCIFNYIVSKVRPFKLYKLCNKERRKKYKKI